MEQRRCYAIFPKGYISFCLAEAHTLIEHGILNPPDDSGRCEVTGSIHIEAITDEATRGAEYDLQNVMFEAVANWLESA